MCLYFSAQSADVYIDDIGLRIEMITPDLVQQHGACENLIRLTHEKLQQTKLHGLKMDLFPSPSDFMGSGVHGQVGNAQQRFMELCVNAPGQGIEPGKQFRKGIGLHQIIVTTGL